jgi:hydrogenase nickel incorporation protein HypB
MEVITVERKILEKNDAIASELRKEFRERHQFVINLLSSPGSGKTSLIERMVVKTRNDFSSAVIVGDVQTDNDARRISALDIPVVQIVTNGGCHLEANLVRDAYKNLMNFKIDLLIIENVGNLVCPAGFDLGEDMKIVLSSITEGEDKPVKYPVVFRNSSAVLINKIDLKPYLSCNARIIKENALKVNPSINVFEISCKTDEGIDEWISWLVLNMKSK